MPRVEITNDELCGRRFRGVRLFLGRRRLAGVELQHATGRCYLFLMCMEWSTAIKVG